MNKDKRPTIDKDTEGPSFADVQRELTKALGKPVDEDAKEIEAALMKRRWKT